MYLLFQVGAQPNRQCNGSLSMCYIFSLALLTSMKVNRMSSWCFLPLGLDLILVNLRLFFEVGFIFILKLFSCCISINRFLNDDTNTWQWLVLAPKGNLCLAYKHIVIIVQPLRINNYLNVSTTV